MIPTNSILTEEITETTYPTRTYKVTFGSTDRVNGYTDGLEAVQQAIYLILSTERYQYIIYSWDYGVELLDLIGKPMPYVMSEIPRRIKDALIQDDRIVDVVDFAFEKNRNKLHTTFTVVTDLGNISTELEVAV
jgi:phage baseplate assembly protein W